MGKCSRMLILLLLLSLGNLSVSSANVINFDNIDTSGGGMIPFSQDFGATLDGFNSHTSGNNSDYRMWLAESYFWYNTTMLESLPALSSPNHGINGGAGYLDLYRATPFLFDGVYLAQYLYESNPTWSTASCVYINGYLNDTLVGSYVAMLDPGAMRYFSPGWNFEIDTLTFVPNGQYLLGGTFLIDDLTYRIPQTDPVIPEPVSFSLLGLGLLGLVVRKRLK